MIRLEHITYSYTDDDQSAALHDVSVEIPTGGLVGIAGSTGSGKSTLLQVTAGLLQPSEGTVTYAAETEEPAPAEVDSPSPEAQRTRKRCLFRKRRAPKSHPHQQLMPDGRPAVGLVFQYPERQLFAQTVIDDVMFGPKNLGRSAEEARTDAQWALETVGLPEAYWERSPFRLSGGEQRRAALAGVLAMRPHTLALDEPTAGQDPARRRELVDLMLKLREQGIGIVLASHDMDLLALCTEATVLHEGQVALQGTPQQVFATADQLAACGLEPPATVQLAAALCAQGIDAPPIFDVETLADALARELQHGCQ